VKEQDEMNDINNEADFKRILESLGVLQQRQVAALFVKHVVNLSDDKRLDRVIKTAADAEATEEELAAALKTAHAVTFDSHARCGAEGHWSDQSGYFVARAAVAAMTSIGHSRVGGPAWQAAMSARMAYTSMLIDDESGEHSAHTECEWQYQCLSDYLND
jgi:phosphohistidine phosphatase SixA